MASQKIILNGTYQEVNAGSATIQRLTRGFGSVMVFMGTAIPGDDTNSFLLEGNSPHYFETADNLYARTPHGVDVEIVVGA